MNTTLHNVAKNIQNKFKSHLELQTAFHDLVRQSVDEVVDSVRTGRKSLAELEKTEKTYIGTKVEILTRNLLKLTKGKKLDLSVDGTEVDVKFTVGKTWMIPMEAFNQICLLIHADEKNGIFGVGLLKMTPSNLTKGENRDKKLSVSALGRSRITWLARNTLKAGA